MIASFDAVAKEPTYRGADLRLFVRDVHDRQGRKRPITVRSWATMKDVKNTIQKALDIPASAQRLYLGPVLSKARRLPNHRTLHDAGIYESGVTLFLDIKNTSSGLSSSLSNDASFSRTSDICISPSVLGFAPREMKSYVSRARRALALGLKPSFILDGSGGSYFIHDARKVKIAVFKPADEEPYAENNPRGYLPQTGHDTVLREGVKPGEGCIREVAAYMLDHGGFSGVPQTTLVEAKHPSFNANGSMLSVAAGGAAMGVHSIGNLDSGLSTKKVGSFQEFVRYECSMDDLSPSMISVDEVHKIAVLDIRILNADRNSANLLCRRRPDNSMELVPIDHGFCLRSAANVSWMDWCWLDWPQMKESMSEKTKEYVRKIDIEQDVKMLQEDLNICREALDFYCASCSVLKAGVDAGLTLYDIAVLCCRNDTTGEHPSRLESLFRMAAELSHSAIENGRWRHSGSSKAVEVPLSPRSSSLLSQSASIGGLAKAKSSENFSLVSEDLNSLISDKRDVPSIVQSSASDTSSDTQEGEAFSEWGPALVAEATMDRAREPTIPMPNRRGKTRALSMESDTSINDGFWHVHPDQSSDTSDGEYDDGSIAWSPATSPKSVSILSNLSLVEDLRMSLYPNLDRTTLLCPDGSISAIKGAPVKKDAPPISLLQARTPRVSFASHLLCEKEVERRDAPAGSPEVPKLLHLPTEMQMKSSNASAGMRRSQSYAALTSNIGKELAGETVRGGRPVDHEQFREYFLKFIDLLIVQETSTLVHHEMTDTSFVQGDLEWDH